MSDEQLNIEENELSMRYEKREEEDLLDYTQRMRLAAVSHLTQHTISTEAKDISALTSVLDGIDRQELNKARLELENQSSKEDQATLELIMGMTLALGNKNPYESTTPIEREVFHDGPVIEGVTLVEGELDNKPRIMNYDSFMKDYKKKNPKQKESDED